MTVVFILLPKDTTYNRCLSVQRC